MEEKRDKERRGENEGRERRGRYEVEGKKEKGERGRGEEREKSPVSVIISVTGCSTCSLVFISMK